MTSWEFKLMNMTLLDLFVKEVEDALDVGASALVPEAVAKCMRPYLKREDFVPERCREGCPEAYTRHVAYIDPDDRFSVIPMVWLPGQGTPIHDHAQWCAVGVLEGVITERRYERVAQEADKVRQLSFLQMDRGNVSFFHPSCANIHRLTNEYDSPAITVHVYEGNIHETGPNVERVFTEVELTRV